MTVSRSLAEVSFLKTFADQMMGKGEDVMTSRDMLRKGHQMESVYKKMNEV